MKYLKNLRFSEPAGEKGSWWILCQKGWLIKSQPCADYLFNGLLGIQTYIPQDNVRLFS